ncbi:MOSC domain-containing protein [Conexibacter sp. SYSU D00693]|uniref:MOSC domain-containing protein n=1 Tax=Conexibacter sp. SYSU D00693 TaxID=2812560 RepID=UPI00196AAE64|nr:MOSC N-terminal beta barrel domain-containing protein [Conexibacter sp. SYSU D00693]
MGVLAIWRYPVKGMLGEQLETVEVGAGGLEGDRRWVVEDEDTGEQIASKRGPTDPRLRACRARMTADGELEVVLPGAGPVVQGVVAVAAALGDLLGRRITVVEHRVVHTGGFLDTDGHHDLAPLHLVTTRSLAHMARVAPSSDWDVRRLRPNLVLDDGAAPGLSEPSLLGRELAGGSGLRVSVSLPTPRCVVPTRAQEELPRDPSLLKAVAREQRWDLGPFGRPACLGLYAEVPHGGRVAAGERLTVGPPNAATPHGAVAAAVDGLVARLSGH